MKKLVLAMVTPILGFGLGFALVFAVLLLMLGACGGKAVFRLSSDENNPYQLEQTLSRRQLPATPTPVSGRPRVFALTAGSPKTIVAYDLDSGNVLWKADADVASRIAVGGDFIVALEGKQLVARDQARGAPRWRAAIDGKFVGAAADRERAYVVSQDGSTWWLAALDGNTGRELWKADAAGELGTPAAHGGVVYAPFLRQWLSIVDGKTGKQLTRVRGVDEQISMLHVTSQRAYYGSKQGVFVLDEKSASGKRADATYGTVTVPPQLEGTAYGVDAYDPVQLAYSAADRKRVLWTTTTVDGQLRLPGEGYAIHYFRYVLGFDPSGELRWAYSHPRVELVASEHTGTVIAGISTNGEIVALDPKTGAVRARKSLGTTSPVLGATFDADGWAPTGEAEPSDPVAVLVAIARDREARFDRVKELAVQRLAKLEGPEVTSHLLTVLSDKRQPAKLKDTVVELLVARHDPSSLPVLVAQLSIRTDYLAGSEPDALGPVAKAIAGLGGQKLDPKAVAAALAALQVHLDAPTTPSSDLALVIGAMAAIGGGAERLALGSHLLLYHASEELGDDAGWQRSIVVALGKGGPGERELLRYVVADPRTRPGLASTIRETLPAD
ncbi:MAG: PQQ-like beta-propeller repeat protein [Deltaproteobacteria bacterium]|nr:PQQ-like beta-propeller repeat protein [Deltaproteobacteria bacterium]MDQ3364090.1 PQQ-like beta-propeller repeat protein [Myxococcota bacterium]